MALIHRTFSVLLMFVLASSVMCSCNRYKCLRNRNERIYGGVSSVRNSRPFQIALTLRVGPEGEIGFCGGSLIHPQWVLSAAHCCFHGDQQITHGQAVLGAYSLYDRFENGRRMINVEEIVVHPDWDPTTFANDLALLKLANTVQMSGVIDIIRLPYLDTESWSFTGNGATASGWGIAAEGTYNSRVLSENDRLLMSLFACDATRQLNDCGLPAVKHFATNRAFSDKTRVTFISPTLREKLLTVMADDLCNTTYMESLPENVVCAFSTTSAGTCKGDNGGPLTMFFSRTEEIILIGVASFVERDGCNNRMPSVFTRVQRHLPWISEITGITLD